MACRGRQLARLLCRDARFLGKMLHLIVLAACNAVVPLETSTTTDEAAQFRATGSPDLGLIASVGIQYMRAQFLLASPVEQPSDGDRWIHEIKARWLPTASLLEERQACVHATRPSAGGS